MFLGANLHISTGANNVIKMLCKRYRVMNEKRSSVNIYIYIYLHFDINCFSYLCSCYLCTSPASKILILKNILYKIILHFFTRKMTLYRHYIQIYFSYQNILARRLIILYL